MPAAKPVHALQRKSTRSAAARATIAAPVAIGVRRAELLEQQVGVGPTASRKHRSLVMVALLLRRRAGLTVEQLRAELSVSRPTLYRMRDDMIAAGLPLVIAERGGVGVWSLDV